MTSQSSCLKAVSHHRLKWLEHVFLHVETDFCTLFAELHVEEQNNYFVFVNATYSVVASDAERIGVDQITKILPSGGSSSGSSQGV